MKSNVVPNFWVQIHIAGDLTLIRHSCNKWCTRHLMCVTVTPTDYVYDGGIQSGATIRFIHYPKHPTDLVSLRRKAKKLARQLMRDCCQKSFTVEDSNFNYWEDHHG